MGILESLFAPRAPDPKAVNIDDTVTGADAYRATSNAQQSLANSQRSLGALQSNYDPSQQRGLVNALAGQRGLQNQSQVFNQQQALAGQLQGVADGTGPNPAQAQLAQATGNNVANQAALMASQRGASANPALLARQAAMQGAGIQQQAAGQAATLQAQQQLNALGALQNQQQAMGQTAAQQVQNQIGATQALGQQQQQQDNFGLQKQQLQNALAGMSMAQQQTMLNQITNQNQARVATQGNVNNINAATNQQQANFGSQLLGGALAGATGGLSTLMAPAAAAPAATYNSPTIAAAPSVTGMAGGQYHLAKGGEVPAPPRARMPSHLEQMAAIFHPEVQQQFSHGGGVQQMIGGGHVPGEAQVKGDSPKNDTVKAMLSPGEVVIPKSVMESQDPVGGSAEFVKAVMNKKQKDPKALESEFKLALKDAMSNRGKKK